LREPVKYPFIRPAVLTVLPAVLTVSIMTLLPPVYSLNPGLPDVRSIPPIPGETSLDVMPMRPWN